MALKTLWRPWNLKWDYTFTWCVWLCTHDLHGTEVIFMLIWLARALWTRLLYMQSYFRLQWLRSDFKHPDSQGHMGWCQIHEAELEINSTSSLVTCTFTHLQWPVNLFVGFNMRSMHTQDHTVSSVRGYAHNTVTEEYNSIYWAGNRNHSCVARHFIFLAHRCSTAPEEMSIVSRLKQ